MSQSRTPLIEMPNSATLSDGIAVARRARRGAWVAHIRANLLGFTVRKSVAALADQTIVSGTSFFSTVLIGRTCGAEELGAYSLGFSLVVLIQSVLNSLVLVPYTVNVNRTGARRCRLYAGTTLVQTGVLTVASVAAVALWGTFLASGVAQSGLSSVIWIVAPVLPFVMLREFARRFGFAHFHAGRALVVDAAVAVVQVGGIVSLSLAGSLSASWALTVMGAACAVAGGTWFVLCRADFRISKRAWRKGFAKNWRFGRWVFASQLASQLNSDVLMLWLLVFMLGKAASGVFAACMSIVLFSNPLILGISYVLTPRIARAFAEGGHRELRHVVAKTALAMGGMMTVFVLVVLLLGGTAIRLLYGPQYTGHEMTIVVLAIGVLIRAVGMGVSNGLWAIDRPELNFRANVVGLVVTLAAATALMPLFQLTGIALALVCGYSVELAVRYHYFRSLTVATAGGMP